MHRYAWMLGLVVLTALFAGPIQAAESGSYDGPRIKFLDDLFGGDYAGHRRDPFAERIETERHDFTQSTKTVGYHVAQIEAGYSYFYNDSNQEIERSHTTPELLLRVGLSDDIEFRVRWNYSWRFIDEGENLAGAEDLRWGIKLGVTDQECLIPESALEIRFTAPTGGTAWSTERVEFGLDYIYEWELNEGWDLYGSTGMSTGGLADFSYLSEDPDTERFITWQQSVALGVDLTERATMYAEWFGVFSHGLESELRTSTFNMGLDYYITDDFIVDFRVGVGLNDDTDDLFTGFGGGYRF